MIYELNKKKFVSFIFSSNGFSIGHRASDIEIDEADGCESIRKWYFNDGDKLFVFFASSRFAFNLNDI